jgi:IS1 family transposase
MDDWDIISLMIPVQYPIDLSPGQKSVPGRKSTKTFELKKLSLQSWFSRANRQPKTFSGRSHRTR